MPEPQRLLLLGDQHGNLVSQDEAIRAAQSFDCDAIFALGDWGYWAHNQSGVNYLRKLARMLKNAGLVQYWLDGNHENHTLLRELYAPGGPNHVSSPDGFWQMADTIFYSPRGHRWTWNGVSFLSLGGAHSIDKEWRLQMEGRSGKMHTLWWPEEMITEEEAQLAMEGGAVDVLLVHDTDDRVDLNLHFATQKNTFMKADSSSQANRRMISRVVDAVRPRYLYGGHYHLRFTDEIELDDGGKVRVECLDCDGSGPRSWTVIDLKDGSVG